MKRLKSSPDELNNIVSAYWQQLRDLPEFHDPALTSLLASDPAFIDEISKVFAASDFVAASVLREPRLLSAIHASRHLQLIQYQPLLEAALSGLSESGFKSGSEKFKKQIRQFHRREFIAILWRDLCGYLNVHQVCVQMSGLADACLQCSLDLLHQWSCSEWGEPKAENLQQSLVVIGMGKLGANELNVSSDIDLIFAYPESGATTSAGGAESITNQQYFTRLSQRLIDALDTVTADGFVFRVDMRLRPYGSEGALVLSFDAMEDYYQNQGRDWERYALIKGRIVAGDQMRGKELLKRLNPFVYRRYLDFSMFESLRDMKVQINKQSRRGKLDADIKLGPGGIREVEFIAQALQLVHGGRDKLLQTPSITQTMEQLKIRGYLPVSAVTELLSAYEFLRNLEHRIQAIDNEQTQRLPEDATRRARVAFAMGAANWGELLTRLELHRSRVAGHFREVLRTDTDRQEPKQASKDWAQLWRFELPGAEAKKLLADEGFEDPEASLAVLEEFRKDRKFVVLATESRRRLDLFMPILLDAVSESERPSLCLARVMPLIEAVCRRTAYLVLLMENPGALRQLVIYCTASPLISEYLSKFPVLLDELLDLLDVPPDKAVLADELRLQLLRIDENSFEEQLECLRYFKQAHLLQVAAADVSGKMPLMKVSDYLTFTAEVILEAVLSLAWQNMVSRHGYPQHSDGSFGKPDFAIIGYGKLGGLELSYNSDLDLVFLHRAKLEADTVTDREGQQCINSRAFYIKLAQRIMVILGTYTMSGKLYDVDVRLRPSGESGMLVSSLESFAEYQQTNAWNWEHQALVRARGVAGNPGLIAAFEQVRSRILSAKRDIGKVAEEVVAMRNRMRSELASSSSAQEEKLAFELKQGSGGIVDIEFLVQFLVLAHSCHCTGLMEYTDNYRILEAAMKCELLEPGDMQTLINAYLELRAASHQLALHQFDALKSVQRLNCQVNVTHIWNAMFGKLVKA